VPLWHTNAAAPFIVDESSKIRWGSRLEVERITSLHNVADSGKVEMRTGNQAIRPRDEPKQRQSRRPRSRLIAIIFPGNLRSPKLNRGHMNDVAPRIKMPDTTRYLVGSVPW
jgi:hypothetical protein